MRTTRTILALILLLASPFILTQFANAAKSPAVRTTENFCKGWKFVRGDVAHGETPGLNDSAWRKLDLPHDWSIEGPFSEDNPATPSGGALPGGIGWYRKSFVVPPTSKGNLTFVEFDGVYRNSEVWINGQYLGKRPYGYSSFRYELTPFLVYGGGPNVIAVKVDNSQQPNSRWYSGSGIYRNVWLVTTGKLCVDHWGTYVTTPEIKEHSAVVAIQSTIRNAFDREQKAVLTTTILDANQKSVGTVRTECVVPKDSLCRVEQRTTVSNPVLWNLSSPHMYTAVTTVESDGKTSDEYATPFGIRSIKFDVDKGFLLNGAQVKIKGVCNHHDLGCLGAAINTRGLERQLELLKSMGCNGIRTSHNPPAPELLDLCDRMGFVVMDEAFDMWKKGKTKFDYSLDWDAWHKRDLDDMVLRDRNHPSIVIWSIGNEISEQWSPEDSSSGATIAKELTGLIRQLDVTRPITSNCNKTTPSNPIIASGALDVIGYSYGQGSYLDFPKTYPGKPFVGSEAVSALESRGSYDMPSDSIRRWPSRWDVPLKSGNADLSCSSYDNCSTPWGSTHEETWRLMKAHDFLSGLFIWTGFDYLGEPTPYSWPARSSYFGILDLAGFPKDAFYLYQSEWTDKPVLHLFPHWNWKKGDSVDVWAYTNCDNVELFLNGKSVGTRKKVGDALHIMWRLQYDPGTLKAVGHSAGKPDLVQEVTTAGSPAAISLKADRTVLTADGNDLSFITAKILDNKGTLAPFADSMVHFALSGEGKIVGVDNGSEVSMEPFNADHRMAYHGMCLVVVQTSAKGGKISLNATAENLKPASVTLESR